jgi:hypothetical protein
MIGFMQGRLSPIRNGRIQSFPWETWEKEFKIGSSLGFNLMEWTIDSENFEGNPLFCGVETGQITKILKSQNFHIQSVTCGYSGTRVKRISHQSRNTGRVTTRTSKSNKK